MNKAVIELQNIKRNFQVGDETVHALPDHTQTFLHDFLEALADRHNLADRFHARTDLAAYTDKLSQVPTRDLYDHVIYFWCFVSGVGSSHLTDFVKAVT